MTPQARRERKLPVQQLAILAVCRFAEPIASTSLFPYLPEMIRSFGIPQNEIGTYAGLCAAAFSLSQALFGIPWGRASDKYGRKPAILLGLLSTMITSLMWGFSRSLWVAILARALQGAGNGNVGIIRTTVAEMVPFKELQPRAFSLMPLVWNIGSIFGPSIGGALANPLDVKPGEHRGNGLLERFPYALPNLVSSAFFAVGITVGFLFLEETLETKRESRDWGLLLGQKITRVGKSQVLKLEEILHLRSRPDSKHSDSETEPLIKPNTHDEEHAFPPEPKRPTPPPPAFHEVLNYQACMNLLAYTLLAAHTMAYDQLLPVFMQYPPLARESALPSNFLKFAGGFGLHHFRIGLLSTFYGIFGMVIQFFLFPPLARHYGILPCLKLTVLVFPLTYLLTPFTALLPTETSQVAVCFAIMLVKCFCAIFAFPCSTILLTNSASSLRVLGTLNGFATSFSAIGRALGPALAGSFFTIGVQRGYVIAPWWLLAGIGILGAVPVFFLVEGEGFGGDEQDGEINDSEDEEVEEVLTAQGLESGTEAQGQKAGPSLLASDNPRLNRESALAEEEEEEEEYGGVGPLSRVTTRSSAVVAGSEDGEEDERQLLRRRTSTLRTGQQRVARRMSIPFGMGGQGVARRYSSNLGQSLGSAGSFGGH